MDLLDRLLAHDSWTTSLILSECGRLKSAQLHQQINAGHGTVHATFVHMIGNVRTWTELMKATVDRMSSAS